MDNILLKLKIVNGVKQKGLANIVERKDFSM